VRVYRIAAFGAAIIAAAVASPEHAAGTTLIGIGIEDCGSWIANEGNPISAANQGTWVLGFLSALNVTRPDTTDILVGQSYNGIYLAIHNYCVANPTGMVENAAFEVANQLGQQRRFK
jgi:hypothetical protein